MKSESSIRSKKALEMILSRLKVFQDPKVRLEQYPTDPEIAAEILWNMHMRKDIGKVSVDLGCGTGMLGIGMLLLAKVRVFMIDMDEDALKVAKENLATVESEYTLLGEAVFECKDVADFDKKVDVVVENPPFGIKKKNADKVFLEKAFSLSDVVYSFHMSETKEFIEKFSSRNGFKITDRWDFNFPLKATYFFHRKKIERVPVSCFRFKRIKE
ncbi:methyltransferase [Candidatus Woesearchaeota archaeon]|nr:methyltransferase [Candidatus Woesearchaeota archaeon]